MKNKFILIVLTLALAFSLVACKGEDANNKKDQLVESHDKKESVDIKTIQVKDLLKEKDLQIIDIRSQDLYLGWQNPQANSGHIQNAMDFSSSWFDYGIEKRHMDMEFQRRGLDKSKKTVIYSDDNIDQASFDKFYQAGFENLYGLDGGFNKYVELGGKTEKLPGYNSYVSPQWVEDLNEGKKVESYNNSKYKIVEITLGSEDDAYKNGHIENAIQIGADQLNHIAGPRDLQDYEMIPLKEQLTFWNLPKDEDILKILEEAGIDKDTTVILYGSVKATTAANRAALVMDYMGVKDIRLLNGGKALWEMEKRPLTKDASKTETVEFGSDKPLNPSIIFSYQDELELIDNPDSVIASVRSWEEYTGKKSGYTYIGEAGEIANSKFAYAGSDPYAMEDFRNIDNTMFNYKLIADRWARWGIVADKTVSFHCGTGWRASETYYIAKALGWKDIGVYVGGWYEWTKMENSPVMERGVPKTAPESKPEQYFY